MKKQAYNPYLPLNEYIPDGEPHVFGDRVYVYGSHDKEGGDYFCMLDYVTYSAPITDLTDWRYEGVIYRAEQDPDYVNHKFMYAPDVVRGNDGRYYLYYSLADRHECSFLMSVAVSDTPSGKFEFLGYVKYPDGRPLQHGVIFDPGLVNDDGRIYLYYGVWYDFDEKPDCTREDSIKYQMQMFKKPYDEIVNTEGGVQGPFVVELEDDMLTIKHTPLHIFPTRFKGTAFEGYEFFEASSLRKVGEKYYFIYSTFNQHQLAYATSDYPDRDFEFGGVIVSNGDIGIDGRLPKDRLNRTDNNHGSIELINGEWYIFYHRHTHKTPYSRQACAEKIKILEDGSIPQVEITSCGLNGGPLVAKGEYPAPICCALTDGNMPHGSVSRVIPHITCANDERFISEIGNGTLIGYKYFAFEGEARLTLKYRSGKEAPNGEFIVRHQINGDPVAKISVKPDKNWTTAQAMLDTKGTRALYLEYKGDGLVDLITFSFD